MIWNVSGKNYLLFKPCTCIRVTYPFKTYETYWKESEARSHGFLIGPTEVSQWTE
jgi:hypothetical protein